MQVEKAILEWTNISQFTENASSTDVKKVSNKNPKLVLGSTLAQLSGDTNAEDELDLGSLREATVNRIDSGDSLSSGTGDLLQLENLGAYAAGRAETETATAKILSPYTQLAGNKSKSHSIAYGGQFGSHSRVSVPTRAHKNAKNSISRTTRNIYIPQKTGTASTINGSGNRKSLVGSKTQDVSRVVKSEPGVRVDKAAVVKCSKKLSVSQMMSSPELSLGYTHSAGKRVSVDASRKTREKIKNVSKKGRIIITSFIF